MPHGTRGLTNQPLRLGRELAGAVFRQGQHHGLLVLWRQGGDLSRRPYSRHPFFDDILELGNSFGGDHLGAVNTRNIDPHHLGSGSSGYFAIGGIIILGRPATLHRRDFGCN